MKALANVAWPHSATSVTGVKGIFVSSQTKLFYGCPLILSLTG